MKAVLALADGRIFSGKSFGATGEATGEVVFNTAMTGYQEVLTDPSYRGQMVTMTYTRSAIRVSTPRISKASSSIFPVSSSRSTTIPIPTGGRR
jgi:carbamoylphosphate synthase small subunit